MAEPKPELFLGDDFVGYYQNASGKSSATFIKRSEIISIAVAASDDATHREKPAVIITTRGTSVHTNIDRTDSNQTKTTMASESLKYNWDFDSYAEALAAAQMLVK